MRILHSLGTTLVGLTVLSPFACSPADPRLPHQQKAPEVPIVPPPSLPAAFATAAMPAPAAPAPEDTATTLLEAPRWEDSARLDTFCRASMARATEQRKALSTPGAERPTGEAAVLAFDRIFRETDTANGLASLLTEVSPDAAVREASANCAQAIAQLRAEVFLDRSVYDALAAVDAASLREPLRRSLSKNLEDFRRSGVDKDEATRARLAAIQGEMKKLSQDYGQTINSDTRTLTFTVEELAGLPADWLANHPKDADGKISVTTDYPDYFPVMEYAQREATRKALWNAFIARGEAKNGETLKSLLALRKEVATRLGRPNWSAYAVEDKMAKTPETVSGFIADLQTAVRPRADKDLARLLEAKRKDTPDATAIEVWDRFYYPNIVRKTDVSVDSEEVRKYFPYAAVKQGIFDLYGELFGVTFTRLEGKTWHSDVELWEMRAGDVVKGRFWLDMHPRADKFKHAAQFGIQTGLVDANGGDTAMPYAALVCNFPAPSNDDKALMGHDDVVTFFHEFGHLIHHLMARGETLELATGIEDDFIEAPSQLLEEWAWDPKILARFTRHADTNEPIPEDLVLRMRKADAFGRGLDVMRQVFLAAYSWFIHERDPATLDIAGLETFTTEIYKAYSPYPRPEVDKLWANFGHLTDYSSNYYTYQWSLAISKDLFSRFATAGLLDQETARAYRDTVLAAGGNADAATLIERFLSRPQNLEAYRTWLASE